jgi:LacI family transcriptional regulator
VRDGVGGIILPPPLSDSNAAWRPLRAAKVPFIAVATGRPDAAGMSVRIDDLEAAAAMTRHLLSLGHRDIGFIVGAPNQTVSAQRQAGFEKALRRRGSGASEWVKQGSFTYRSGLVAAEQILDSARVTRPRFSRVTTTWRPPRSRWRIDCTSTCPRI